VKTQDNELRTWLVNFLTGGQAYMTFDEAIADFPPQHFNTKAQNVDYTFWHILEHIRITQWDILDFSRNPKYKYINWPADYWPAQSAKATIAEWDQTIKQIKTDLQEMIALVQNPKNDLYTPFPWGEGQHLLREAILVSEHNAYHIGEFAVLRQVVAAWPKKRKA